MTLTPATTSLRPHLAEPGDGFVARHIGPDDAAVETMLATVGFDTLDDLLDAVVPPSIRVDAPLDLPAARSEVEVTEALRRLAAANTVRTSLIGTGWYATVTPPVIRRNILENPAWYTAYTPYQPEISQGRLEAVLNFQTMVAELTGTELANASMLDEATAAAEAMALVHRMNPKAGDVFVADHDTHPQTLAVLATRAEPLGLTLVLADPADPLPEGCFGVLVSYPGSSGAIRPLGPIVTAAHGSGALVVAATDLLACCLLTPPGDEGADVVVGSTQRFGVPMGFGGPSAGFLSTREAYKRTLPGRLVGVSIDAAGRPAYRLALQTREQHIRREKATSNICTAQVLLAVMAGMYGVWHGPEGLVRIATRVHRLTTVLAEGLRSAGAARVHDAFFDTLTVSVPGRAETVHAAAADLGLDLRSIDADHVGLSLDETSTVETVRLVWRAFGVTPAHPIHALDDATPDAIPADVRRSSAFCTHPVFHQHRSETEMLRYLRRLADADLALDRTMIPLGSCTMKLNATTEMEPVSWPGFADLHPFATPDDTAGYRALIGDLERWLCEITGYDAVSLQPNAGSQGEFAGLLAIRAWHHSRGDADRDVCLIPASAHGTNAASAAMVGMRVVVVACDEDGNVALDDLTAKLEAHRRDVAALMITYPSTHGVFEEAIGEICAAVHDAGGQVYLDGANLNALVGVARPGRFGADVSHLNLHKTFCIPHGGGGPGVGPVAVRSHLAPFLPSHPVVPVAGPPVPRGRRGLGGAVGVRGHLADPMGVHRHDGSRRTASGHGGRHPQRQLHRSAAGRGLPDPLHRS